ncbi:hypothetical protein GTW40_32490 [Streptomyces sp. SID4985]|uniref:hypothetical protein n=1 Tax=Streptomyces sp. SID4985 TaxID=2690292 RepID=UPI001371E9F6|nr:hypothetical protein [Streptomyces sp. SID4985]MYQ49680.1 hypothetical protein [Streptomyces sp. SID4985]
MAYDPTEPDAIEELESGGETVEEIGVEEPENDAAEQQTDVAEDRDEPLTDVDPAKGNEADLIEQARVVTLDEDDYR